MSRIGHGYGSEWHLLNYLGYHRRRLTEQVTQALNRTDLQWLDVPFLSDGLTDGEWKGVDFLPPTHPARQRWAEFWPQRGNVQNWDAVGRCQGPDGEEWVLVEAKAHLQEIETECGAKPSGGLDKITRAFEQVIEQMGLSAPVEHWLRPYYQYANRLATLWLLEDEGVRARLLFIYFTGDAIKGRSCPSNACGWHDALTQMDQHLGLRGNTLIEQRVHKLFLPTVHRVHGS